MVAVFLKQHKLCIRGQQEISVRSKVCEQCYGLLNSNCPDGEVKQKSNINLASSLVDKVFSKLELYLPFYDSLCYNGISCIRV